jgi:hypothetical protein
MKKMLIVALLLFVTVGSSFGSILVKVAMFAPTDSDFDGIYGRGLMYGGEYLFKVSNSLNLWIGVNYLHMNGKMLFTQEDTSLTLIPIAGGIKYNFISGKTFSPYVAAGLEYVLFKESNIIETVNSGAFGFVARGGVTIHLGPKFGFDFFGGYSSCKMKPFDLEFNVGGLEAGAGLVFSF